MVTERERQLDGFSDSIVCEFVVWQFVPSKDDTSMYISLVSFLASSVIKINGIEFICFQGDLNTYMINNNNNNNNSFLVVNREALRVLSKSFLKKIQTKDEKKNRRNLVYCFSKIIDRTSTVFFLFLN